MLNKLKALADQLDKKGRYRQANTVDDIIKALADFDEITEEIEAPKQLSPQEEEALHYINQKIIYHGDKIRDLTQQFPNIKPVIDAAQDELYGRQKEPDQLFYRELTLNLSPQEKEALALVEMSLEARLLLKDQKIDLTGSAASNRPGYVEHPQERELEIQTPIIERVYHDEYEVA
jgi:hypothetical protein